jgi:toxin ParE1/3/4
MPGPKLHLVWSPEAEDDLLTIWRWIAAHFSADVADAHLRDINRTAQNLTEFPNSGVKRDRIVPNIRSVLVYPMVIFYRIAGQSIEIARVVDGRRNLAAFFSSDHGD